MRDADADADAMRRTVIASVLIAVVLILVHSETLATIALGVLILAALALLVLKVRNRQERASAVPWYVSLGVSALLTLPQGIPFHHNSAAAGVFAGMIVWLLLAAFLRFVIFLADYLRSRFARP
jgi:apolipoprotein N-acyltransferase